MFDNLDDENIFIYSIKAYEKPNCVITEFEDDVRRFNYIQKLFTKYTKSGDIKERLIINHLIILNNVFTPEVVTRLLFYKISPEHYSILKTFLLFLNIMPERVKGIMGRDIISSDISVDMNVVQILRRL
jgi:hypothetical protein